MLWLLDSTQTNPNLEDLLRFSKTTSFKEAHTHVLKEIEKQELTKVYEEIELPLIPVVEAMRVRGVKIDIKYLEKLSKEYHIKLERYRKDIWEDAGEEFNINSPKQLGNVLFDKLKVNTKNIKKTSKE